METPPRRPPPTPHGRCLLGGELALPLASPISDRLSTRWRRDENSDAMVLNSPFPKLPQPLVIEDVFTDGAAGRVAQPQQLARAGEASPLQVESTAAAPAAEPAAGRRVVGGETVRKDSPASPVRRSLRIMGLQKFTNEVEITPVKQVGKPRGGRPGLRSRSTGTGRQPQRRTPKRNSGDRKAGMGPVSKRLREL